MSDCCSPNNNLPENDTRNRIREDYAKVARANDAGESSGNASSCCGVDEDAQINTLISTRLGYSQSDLLQVPEGADLGLGCGNPQAIAAIQAGETVVDLGSGAGFDCFLAAQHVGEKGRVIGVDMTPDMLNKARGNGKRGDYNNVEFRLGEIEHLPIADSTVDVIISNCVINLSPEKPQVFNDAFRVLKPGGRLAISDVVATAEMPEHMRNDPQLLSGCMAGAALIDDLKRWLSDAGFANINILAKDESVEFIRDWAPDKPVTDYVVAATIEATKPSGGCCG